MVELVEGLRKQEFSPDWLLSEGEDSSMIGYLVRGTVTLFLFVLKQNCEAAFFCFILS